MTVRLRPHHLLCMLTYVGKGYTPAFTENFDAIAGRLNRGEEIEIVSGRDDVCAALAGDDESHCLVDSVCERDRVAAGDLTGLLGVPVRNGGCFRLDADRLAHMRAAFFGGALRGACGGCQWNGLCSSIASDGYRSVRIDI